MKIEKGERADGCNEKQNTADFRQFETVALPFQ